MLRVMIGLKMSPQFSTDEEQNHNQSHLVPVILPSL